MYAEEEETVDEDEVENSINQDTSIDSIVCRRRGHGIIKTGVSVCFGSRAM
jgi:hypothetical protein